MVIQRNIKDIVKKKKFQLEKTWFHTCDTFNFQHAILHLLHLLSQCCDLGYHSSLSRALRTYLSAELSLEASRRAGLEVLEGAVEGLDPARDRQRLLGLYPTAFCPPQRFGFQAHMGDSVSVTTRCVCKHTWEFNFNLDLEI